MAESAYVGISTGIEPITGVTQLEYIESTGTQYIDTGVAGNSIYGFEFYFTPTSLVNSYQSYLAGTVDNFTIGAFGALNKSYFRHRANEIVEQATLSTSSVNTLLLKNNQYSVNENSYPVDTSNSVSTTSSNIYVMNNSSSNRTSGIKVYSLKLYGVNNDLIRDFVPAKDGNEVVCLYDKITDEFYYNQGTGTFIAGSEIPAGDVAKKIAKMYVGTGNMARKVIKGYIGVNGVAKQFYSSIPQRTISYYGTLSSLSSSRAPASAKTADYALFGGGSVQSTVDCYNSSLTRGTVNNLSFSTDSTSGSHNDNYALFAGGETGWDRVATVNAYNNSLTRSTPTSLTYSCRGASTTTFNGHAIFASGYNLSTVFSQVQAYDNSLTKITLPNMSVARHNAGASHNNNYLILAGGDTNRNSNVVTTIDAYDTSFTKIVTAAELSVARQGAIGGNINNNALFICRSRHC